MDEMQEELTLFEKLLDEENDDNITLVNAEGEEIEFEQVAIIPENGELYAILYPVTKIDGIEEDEALAFKLVFGNEDAEDELVVVTDDEILEKIFNSYYKLLDEQ